MSNKKILIVDDDQMVRKMVTMTLEYKDYEVISAKDGADALEKIKQGPFDLVIVDIIMPNMDGFELIKKLRADAAYKDLPISVLSTEGQEQNREQGLALGANSYLVKPFQSEDFLASVEALLKKAA